MKRFAVAALMVLTLSMVGCWEDRSCCDTIRDQQKETRRDLIATCESLDGLCHYTESNTCSLFVNVNTSKLKTAIEDQITKELEKAKIDVTRAEVKMRIEIGAQDAVDEIFSKAHCATVKEYTVAERRSMAGETSKIDITNTRKDRVTKQISDARESIVRSKVQSIERRMIDTGIAKATPQKEAEVPVKIKPKENK